RMLQSAVNIFAKIISSSYVYSTPVHTPIDYITLAEKAFSRFCHKRHSPNNLSQARAATPLLDGAVLCGRKRLPIILRSTAIKCSRIRGKRTKEHRKRFKTPGLLVRYRYGLCPRNLHIAFFEWILFQPVGYNLGTYKQIVVRYIEVCFGSRDNFKDTRLGLCCRYADDPDLIIDSGFYFHPNVQRTILERQFLKKYTRS